jgi:hypothetical protein
VHTRAAGWCPMCKYTYVCSTKTVRGLLIVTLCDQLRAFTAAAALCLSWDIYSSIQLAQSCDGTAACITVYVHVATAECPKARI